MHNDGDDGGRFLGNRNDFPKQESAFGMRHSPIRGTSGDGYAINLLGCDLGWVCAAVIQYCTVRGWHCLNPVAARECNAWFPLVIPLLPVC
jgi:hypothetical protein